MATLPYPLPEPEVYPQFRSFKLRVPDRIWNNYSLGQVRWQAQASKDNAGFSSWEFLEYVDQQDYLHDVQKTFWDNSEIGITPNEIPPFYRYRYSVFVQGDDDQNGYWTDFSDEAMSGKMQDTQDLVGPVEGETIVPGSIPPGSFEPGAIGSSDISAGSITAINIAAGAITSNLIQAGAVLAGAIAATSIYGYHVSANAISAGHIAAQSIYAGAIQAGAVQAGNIAATSITAQEIQAASINGTHIKDGVIEGVKLKDGTITASKITSNTITAAQLAVGFIDANVSKNAYLEAEAVKGGELTLGGMDERRNQWLSSTGDLYYPWILEGDTSDVGTKYSTSYGSTARITVTNNAVISAGGRLGILYNRNNSTNRIKTIYFHITTNLPTGLQFQMYSKDSTTVYRRPISVLAGDGYYVTTSYNTSGDTESVSFLNDQSYAAGMPGTIGFMVYNPSGGTVTVPASGNYYAEISIAKIEFEKGYGTLSVFDSASRLRAEITSDYIGFNKLDPFGAPQQTFRADSNGVWVPQDGLTIGSSKISNLSYNLRDLSGGLVINPRFENLSITDPTKILPSDWTYLAYSRDIGSVNRTNFGYNDGVLPQQQSLISGRVMTMTFPPGYDYRWKFRAISHKRYTQPTSNLPIVPFTTSAYFRGLQAQGITATQYTYSSTSSADITSGTDLAGDTLLGFNSLDDSTFGSQTIDGQYTFKPIMYSYKQASGITGDTMIVSNVAGSYVYTVLEARPLLWYDNFYWNTQYQAVATPTVSTPLQVYSVDDLQTGATSAFNMSQWLSITNNWATPKDGIIIGNRNVYMTYKLATPPSDNVAAQLKIKAAALPSATINMGLILKSGMWATPATPINSLSLRLLTTGLQVIKTESRVNKQLANTNLSTPMRDGRDYWLRGEVKGNAVRGELWVEDPMLAETVNAATPWAATPVDVVNYVLTGTDSLYYGPNTRGRVGVWFTAGNLGTKYLRFTDLYASAITGWTSSSTPIIEWDNVDLALGETITPSDNQPIADLARRITDLQTVAQYTYSGTKAILPEVSNQVQGLVITVVN